MNSIKDCPNYSSFALFADRALTLAEANGRPWFLMNPERSRQTIVSRMERIAKRGRQVFAPGFHGFGGLCGDEPLGLVWVGRTQGGLAQLIADMPSLCIVPDTVIVIENGTDFPEGVEFGAKYRQGAAYCFTIPEGSAYLDALYRIPPGDTAESAPQNDEGVEPSAPSSPQHE